MASTVSRSSVYPMTTPAPAQAVDAAKLAPKPKKKTLRKSVGVVLIDRSTKKVLLLTSRKREGKLVLPRGDCEENESVDVAVSRILNAEAGIREKQAPRRLATYTEANKRGKIVAHHTMFELNDAALLDQWPSMKERQRVWATYEQALVALEERPYSVMALKQSSLARA
ncbi:hypothetical protein BCR43DRAFT_562709 [Syncephalastrum racemosum]|uniref:Nudix hydrolase domain-containing protein n=1 Tax=Syncephalastrum racemosum TaxID=13706 RepID=A0A1X2HE61_SYNRA|nr:hypothetical protein BCR43DRAFT_562709 [Syncephalastrum racemosum]